MATTFPTSLQDLDATRGTASDSLSAVNHVTHHQTEDDTIEALQAKVGVDGSAVTTTHDYKLSAVTGSAKALTSGTSTQSVTNLTLVTPTITLGSDATGDMYYRSSGGAFSRFAIGSAGQILQVSSGGIPEWIANPSAADASTTTKGVVEEATQAEVDSGTTAGGTSARLFVNPSTVRAKKYHDKGTPSGGTDAYAFTVSPAITALSDGQIFAFEADVANTDSASLNVSTLGAKTLKKHKSHNLETGDIVAGQYLMVAYDSTDDVMHLLSPLASTPSINTTPNTELRFSTYFTQTSRIDADLGWTITGTPTFGANWVSVSANTNTRAYIPLYGNPTSWDSNLDWNSGVDVRVAYLMTNNLISTGTTPSGSSDVWYFHGFGPNTSPSTIADITDVTRRAGFAHYDGRIYAVTANGTNVETTDIQADSTDTKRHFLIDFTSTQVRYYINGSLVATHTTRVPNDANQMGVSFGGYDSSGGVPGFGISGSIIISETLS